MTGNLGGVIGRDGKSAYEVALKNGYEGSETEWLESLKGEKGNPGEVGSPGRDGVDGKDGYTPIKGIDYFDGEKGEPGYTPKKGVDYFDGAKGDDGYTPVKGKDYFDGVSATHKWEGTVLKITSASGTSSANLKGEKGDKGEQGTGVKILGSYESEEALNAAHPTGNIGDGYLVNGSLHVWSEVTSTWENVGNIKGEKGDDGYTPRKDIDYFDGKDGKDGKDGYTPVKNVDYFDGKDGVNGKDGVSVTHSWNGTTLTITSASGTSSANLKGDKGDPGEGSGDMLSDVYDPQGKMTDIFAYADLRADVAISQIQEQFAVGDSADEISNVYSWMQATSPSGFNARQRSCCFGNGYYVIAGTSGQMVYSRDGVTWTMVSAFTTSVITGLAYGNGRFVAVDSDGNIFSAALPSDTWKKVYTNPVIIESVRYLNNRFVAVGDSGFLATSLDAVSWNQHTVITENTLIDSAYGNGYYIAAGHAGTIIRSINLTDWFDCSISDFGDVRTALFTGDGFVIGGQGGKIAYSDDGAVWNMATNNTTSSVNWIRAFAYAEKRIYAVMYISTGAGEIWISKDGGRTWTVDKSVAGRLWCAVYGDGRFVTSGDSGAIYSLDLGIEWTDEEPSDGESVWHRYIATLSNGDRIISESYKTNIPQKGDKGDKGDTGADYVLTDADKTEIAEMAGAKVDLTNYVTRDDVATEDEAGVVYINPAAGISAQYGVLRVNYAPVSAIEKKQSQYLPIVPKTIDSAVKVGITTNTNTLTDDEKATACNWIGAVNKASSETWTFTLEDGSTVTKAVYVG